MKTSTAVAYFGSKAALARALKISRQAVTDWGEDVPELRELQLEKLTDGALEAAAIEPGPPPELPAHLVAWLDTRYGRSE